MQGIEVESTNNLIDVNEITNLEYLSAGTFGKVYKGTYKDEFVAVKESSRNAKDIIRELKTMNLIGYHPNIVILKGIIVDKKEDSVKLVLEFSEMGTLHKIIHRNRQLRYNMKHVITWMLGISHGIQYLHMHDRGPFVHRDLKPQNVLIFSKGLLAKVCDFGTATTLKLRMSNNIGSVYYIAPEVIKGNSYDEKCDIYSLGVILGEVLTRKHPYAGFISDNMTNHAMSFLIAIKGLLPYKIKIDLPIIQNLYSGCLKSDPLKRPSTGQIIESLVEIQKLEKTKATPLDEAWPSKETDLKFLEILFGKNDPTIQKIMDLITRIRDCIHVDPEKIAQLSLALTYKASEVAYKRELEILESLSNPDEIKKLNGNMKNEIQSVSKHLFS